MHLVYVLRGKLWGKNERGQTISSLDKRLKTISEVRSESMIFTVFVSQEACLVGTGYSWGGDGYTEDVNKLLGCRIDIIEIQPGDRDIGYSVLLEIICLFVDLGTKLTEHWCDINTMGSAGIHSG